MSVEDALALPEGLYLDDISHVFLEELLVGLNVGEEALVRVLLGRERHIQRLQGGLAHEPERQAQREVRGGICRVVHQPAGVHSSRHVRHVS